MYCNFFGFSEKPFDVTPDPKFLYLSPGHQEMLATLIYGIRERKGFMTIVGEVGTGKTTLLNTVLGRLDEKTSATFIFNTDVTFDEMLTTALVDLGLAKPEEIVPKPAALRRLNDFAIRQLSTGGNVVLLVDEAQNLDRAAMESLRLLSNLETRKHKLIQIVLSGQPELDVKLNQAELRQLAQRISLKRYITPLKEQETYEYIQHRLSMADYNGPALFDRQARKMIWEYSGGVPRKINVLCDNALLIAYSLRQKRIGVSVVEEAIKDLSWSPFSGAREAREQRPVQPTPLSQGKASHSRFAMAASLVFTACVMLFVGLLLGSSRLDLAEIRLLPVWASIRAKIPIQMVRPDSQPVSAKEVAIAEEGALSTLLQERAESGQPTVLEAPRGLQGLDNMPAGPGAQEPLAHPEAIGWVADPGKRRTVVVKTGENLFQIILQSYGRYDGRLLKAVLRENPEIQNPDHITARQVVRLPEEK